MTAAPSDPTKLLQHCKLLVLQGTAHRQLAQRREGGTSLGIEGGGGHLSASLHGFEAACKVEGQQVQDGGQDRLADVMAEAALRLALLCKDILQVGLAVLHHNKQTW